MNFIQRRWLIILGAIGLHISIGSVYAWSVFTKPIMAYLNCSLSEVQFAFSLAIFFLGTTAAFFGKFIEKYGPKKSGLIAACFFATGMIGGGISVYYHALIGLYIAYGMIGGIGLGTAYLAPVSSLIKSFPEHKGFAAGAAIMSFGFGAAVCGPVANMLMSIMPVYMTMIVMGIAYFAVMILVSLIFTKMPTISKEAYMNGFTRKEAMKTKTFYKLWFMLFFNIFAGIAIIATMSPIAQELINVSVTQAATIVGIVGIFNGLGRIIIPIISDKLGRKLVYSSVYIAELIAFGILLCNPTVVTFQVAMYILAAGYGAGFALIAPYAADVFGTRNVGSIHGAILFSWSIAGVFAPMLLAFIHNLTGSFVNIFYVNIVILIIAFIISVTVSREYIADKSEDIDED